MSYSRTDVYVVDPQGDFFVDIIQTDDEEDNIWDEDDSDQFDDLDPYGEYFDETGQDFHIDPEDPEEREDKLVERRFLPDQPSGESNEEEDQGNSPGEGGKNPSEDPEPKRLRRISYKVSSKCLSLGSDYFKAIFRKHAWPESEQGRVEIRALWKGSKAFKILMQIAHLQFIKIPDQLTTDNMVHLIRAADYLKMEPLFNPWVFRWGFVSEDLEESEENYMKRLYINMHLCYAKDFRHSYNKLVESYGPEFSTHGLLIPENLLDSLKHSRQQKIRKLMSTVQDIITIYVQNDDFLNEYKWCSVRCKRQLFGHLILQLHRHCLYPPGDPESPTERKSYQHVHELVIRMMTGVEATACVSARENAPTCSLDWALEMIRDIETELPLPDSERVGAYKPGWQKVQLKTWVLYRKGRSLDTVDWIRTRRK